jgi:hypothetical protein
MAPFIALTLDAPRAIDRPRQRALRREIFLAQARRFLTASGEADCGGSEKRLSAGPILHAGER